MTYQIAKLEEIADLSRFSVSLGNVPFLPGQCLVSTLRLGREVVGFAAVQNACHAAGSWVSPEHRRNGHTYQLRKCLENEMRSKGIPLYFAVPGNDFEKELFAKYGPVSEHIVQMKRLGA